MGKEIFLSFLSLDYVNGDVARCRSLGSFHATPVRSNKAFKKMHLHTQKKKDGGGEGEQQSIY